MRKNVISKAGAFVAAFLFAGTALGATVPPFFGRTFNWETQCEKGNCYTATPRRVFSEDGRVYVQFTSRRVAKYGVPLLMVVDRSGHADIRDIPFVNGTTYVVPFIPHGLLLVQSRAVLKITHGKFRHYHYVRFMGWPLSFIHGRKVDDWISKNDSGSDGIWPITYVIKPDAFCYNKIRHIFVFTGVVRTSILKHKSTMLKADFGFGAQVHLPQTASYALVGATACEAVLDQEASANGDNRATKCRMARVSPAGE